MKPAPPVTRQFDVPDVSMGLLMGQLEKVTAGLQSPCGLRADPIAQRVRACKAGAAARSVEPRRLTCFGTIIYMVIPGCAAGRRALHCGVPAIVRARPSKSGR